MAAIPGMKCYYGDDTGMKYEEGLPDKEGSNGRAGPRTRKSGRDVPSLRAVCGFRMAVRGGPIKKERGFTAALLTNLNNQ